MAHPSSSPPPLLIYIFERSVNSAVILSLPPAPGNLFNSQSVKHSNSKQKAQVVSKTKTLLALSLNGSHETVNEALYRKTKARDAAMARRFQRSMLSSSRRHSLPQVPSLSLSLSLSLKFVLLSFKYSITVYGFVSFYFWKAKVCWQVEKAFDQNRAMFSTEWFYFLRKVNFFESLYIL